MMQSEETPREEYRRVTEDVLDGMRRPGPIYFVALGLALLVLLGGAAAEVNQIFKGMGVSGLMHPIMWAVYITNFVFWVGIAHSGTLISAILFLFRAPFRVAFSRAAEAMTVIAIFIAASFPLVHLGRIWRGYWVFPYPNERQIWPNFRSPLILDVFAVSTYLTVSILYFALGLVPDVAVVRDRARGWRRTLYGVLSLGWEGTARQWKHYLMAYSITAGFAAPLVISVHSVVSWDFASALVPGWHSTIFAPYFVAGAIFSGLAMVLTLLIPLRAILRLERYISIDRLEKLSVLLLVMSLIVTYSYIDEYFMTWYGGEAAELINLHYKAMQNFAPQFWLMTFCNSIVPIVLFWKGMRRNIYVLFTLSILVNIGMWLERFVIIAGSLARDYEPYGWSQFGYHISLTEAAITAATFAGLLSAFLLFAKLLPVLPIAEFRNEMLTERRQQSALGRAGIAERGGGHE